MACIAYLRKVNLIYYLYSYYSFDKANQRKNTKINQRKTKQ